MMMGVFGKLLTSLSSDKELIESIQKGDNDKFSILYERYYQKLYQYTLGILNFNVSETEEIITEVFLQIFNYIKTGKEIDNPNAIFYRIAHNVVRHFIQDNKKNSSSNLEELETKVDEDSNVDEIVDKNYKQELLNFALNNLDDDAFIVMYCFYKLNKSYAEIEDEFKIPAKKIGSIVYYAKQTLKDFIFNQNEESIPKDIEKEVDNRYQLLKTTYIIPSL